MLRVKGPNVPVKPVAAVPVPDAPSPDVTADTPQVDPAVTAQAPTAPETDSATEEDDELLPQALVVYMTSDEGPFRCDNCNFYVDANACSKVEGPIDPGGCCNLFMPPSGAEEPADSGADVTPPDAPKSRSLI